MECMILHKIESVRFSNGIRESIIPVSYTHLSALRLLEALPATTELTRRESARYALLLAQATDKCENPLLPCDSLLDVALDYYCLLYTSNKYAVKDSFGNIYEKSP